jgi:hypothetical protein
VVVLLAGIAAVGYFAYTAGMTQGQAVAPDAPQVEAAAGWHAGWGFHPFHGLAFLPLLICLVPFFLCLFVFMPLRMIFGPNRMRMHMHGRWHEGCCGDEVPSPIEEWHRRMHEEKKTGG